MKKAFKIFKFIGIIILMLILLRCIYIGTFFIIDYIRVKTFKPPERLSMIPEGAKWIGGPDGGEWFFLRRKQNSIYYIEIYDDLTGIKIYDTSFVANKICNEKIDTIKNIVQYFTFFNGHKIYLNLTNGSNLSCYLEMSNHNNSFHNERFEKKH